MVELAPDERQPDHTGKTLDARKPAMTIVIRVKARINPDQDGRLSRYVIRCLR